MPRLLFLPLAMAIACSKPCKADQPELMLQIGHTGRICTAAFSQDGKWVMTASDDGSVSLWDSVTGKRLREYRGSQGMLLAAAMSPDGKRIIASNGGHHAFLWDTLTGKLLREFDGDSDFDSAVGFSKDGRLILTASGGRTLLREPEKGRTVIEINGGLGQLTPDGKFVLTRGEKAGLFDASNGKLVRSFDGDPRFVNWPLLSPDGSLVATTGYGSMTPMVWQTATGTKVREFPKDEIALAISPDNKRLIANRKELAPIVWDIASGETVFLLEGSKTAITAATYSTDGRRIVTGDKNGGVIIWDAATGRQLVALAGLISGVSAQAVSPDGRLIALSYQDKCVGVWDAATGVKILSPPAFADWIVSLAFSADSKMLAVGRSRKGKGGGATVFDLTTGKSFKSFELPDRVGALQFTPKGDNLVTFYGGYSGREQAKVWSMATGAVVRKFEDKNTLFETGFGQTILANGRSAPHSVWLIDALNGETSAKFDGGEGFFSAWVTSDDSRFLTMYVGDKNVTQLRMRDRKTGKELWAAPSNYFPPHGNFSADNGHFLAIGSGSVYLWDTQKGQLERTIDTSFLSAAVIRPDAKLILTGESNGATRFWDASSGKELGRLISVDDGKDWLVMTPEGLFDGSPGGRRKVSFRVGGELDIVPVDRFFQDFYRPGLLAAIWKGESPLPEVKLGQQKPPLLRLAAVPAATSVAELTITVEAIDQNGGVRGPWLMHNGARLLAPGPSERRGGLVRKTFTIVLAPGANRLEVRAASADGSWESEPARAEVLFRKAAEKPQLHLVAVGINKYAQGTFDLRFAAADAQAVADLFCKRGGSLYQPIEPRILTDDKATRENVRTALCESAAAARPADTLVVFLAGHGATVEGRYYFIPHEFQLHDNVRLDDDIRKQAITLQELSEWLTAVPALKRVLILDTCNSGAAVAVNGGRSRDPFAFYGTVERLSREQGLCTIAAAAAGAEAQETPELGHGILSYALLAGLRGVDVGPLRDTSVQPTDAAGVADVLEWFSFASGHTRRLSHRYFGREQQVKMSVEGDSFPILPLGK